MRDFRVVPVIIGFLLVGCVTTEGPDIKSTWGALSNADKLKCVFVPKSIHDIETKSMDYVSGNKNSGFVLSAKGRDGAQRVYFLDQKIMQNFTATAEDLQNIALGEKINYLGSFANNGLIYIVIENEGSDESKFLEIREMQKNIVIASSAKFPRSVRATQALVSPEGIWLLTTNDGDSNDDAIKLEFGVIDWSQNKIDLFNIREFKVGDSIHFVTQEGGGEYAVFWMGSGQGQQSEYIYNYQVFRGSKALTGEKHFSVKNKLPLENWTITGRWDSQFWLLMTMGDSLLGNASLLMIDLQKNGDNNIQMQRMNTLDLTDKHFAVPQITTINNRPMLILPTWLDAESTVGLYEIEQDSIKFVGNRGIFPEGTALNDIFSIGSSHELWGSFKRQDGFAFANQLCRLN